MNKDSILNNFHKIIIVFCFCITVLSTQIPQVNANIYIQDYPFDLPIKPNTKFYLTATPKSHSTDGNRAAIDFQIIDKMGFIDKGTPLYSPFDGSAKYIESPNGSGVLEIVNKDKQWKVVIAHIANDTALAKELVSTYPKHVCKDELVAYQGDSGYTINGARFATHVHFEVFILENGEYTNNNQLIDICSKIRLKEYCDWIDDSGYVIFINDK